MLKHKLVQDLKKAMAVAGYPEPDDIVCNIPSNSSFGDFSTNVALQLSNLKSDNDSHSPREIANKIVENFPQVDYLDKIEVAGAGFINVFVKKDQLLVQLYEIFKRGEDFGKSDLGQGSKIQLEFVSANPTGPLTLVNGRSGSMGDSLANILRWSGFDVEKEYYVNDTGNQVRLLGDSVKAVVGKAEVRDDHYKGEYVKELAEKFSDKIDLDSQELGHLISDYFLEQEIKPAVKRLGLDFDSYYSERQLYEGGIINETLDLLKQKDLAYENEGAVWFRSTKFGDEKDRVLVTSEDKRGKKEPTYFLADIAHHVDVLKRGYQIRINILGADHHSYMQRLTAVLQVLYPNIQFDIILMQMVKLFKDGHEVRMSRRAGTYVTLDELLDQVPKDAARFFFLMYAPDSHIDFNLNLAIERSNKNPVYYIQYAHARMSGILQKANQNVSEFDASLLQTPTEIALIKHLTIYEDLIAEIAQSYQVHRLADYTLRLADLTNKFYETSPVTGQEPELTQARLALVIATQNVLKNSLNLMGINAPDQM